ncbi:lytic transglycosylase domain-containing protein [Nocardiopsis ansamitocini]|uniref:aggregation-promoting factor C-terminal-like domain-containing protein n=1 Tax=Nocardiopsis ansamitocini TaxID=1670832 RepID=UPI002553CF73|nr:lytic transglycosylase domain-containing protein [Nocardiopsis ansamitocini]
MLKNRISLRVATAAGAAAVVVAGTAFGVSAFADTGAVPDQAASAAVLPEDAPVEEEIPFFVDSDPLTQEARQNLRAQATTERDAAVDAGSASAQGEVAPEKEEEEEEAEEETSGGGDQGGGGSTSPVPASESKAIAREQLTARGWGDDQFSCLESLWEKESNWNHLAQNPSSGAYGIPQSLPGSKMASAGSDWQTNPATQIKWGLGYIKDRYGAPCDAWQHSQNNGWY